MFAACRQWLNDRLLKEMPPACQALALLRVGTGLFFLAQGLGKLGNHAFARTLQDFLPQWAAQTPFGFYGAFLRQLILPHMDLLSWLIPSGELAIGASLISGLLVRWSTPGAIWMNLNFLLATQHTSPAALGVNSAFILIALTLWWGNAGRYCGLDGRLWRASRDILASPSVNAGTSEPCQTHAHGVTPLQSHATPSALTHETAKASRKPKKSKPF